LLQQAAPTRAEGRPDGDFTQSAGRAHEQQIGDIRAGDQKYERDRGQQNQQPQTHAFGGIGEHGKRVGSPALVSVRPLGGDLPRYRAQIRLRGFKSNARLQPRDDSEVPGRRPTPWNARWEAASRHRRFPSAG